MNDIINIGGMECYEDGGTAYLKLETVARGLGFTQIAHSGNEVVRWERVDKYLRELTVPTCGDERTADYSRPDFIPENVFYRLAMKAKNEAAERFQAFIADEVIPSIRKTGGYIAGQNELSPEELMAKALLVAQSTLAQRDERISALLAENAQQKQAIEDFRPVQEYIDTILSSEGTMATTQIAADYDLSATRLNKILHEEGLQRNVNGQWILYSRHMGKGFTKSKTFHFNHSDGRPDTKIQTQWTQKGRLLIHEILTRRGILAVMDRRNAM